MTKLHGSVPCSGQVRCLEGHFLETTLTHGDDLDGTDHGLTVVKFTG